MILWMILKICESQLFNVFNNSLEIYFYKSKKVKSDSKIKCDP